MSCQSLVIQCQVIQLQYFLHVGHFVVNFLPIPSQRFPQLLSLRQEYDVDDHVGEVVWKIARSQLSYDSPEDLVGLFGESAFLKHIAI